MRKITGLPTDTIALGGAYMMGRVVTSFCKFIFFSLTFSSPRRLHD